MEDLPSSYASALFSLLKEEEYPSYCDALRLLSSAMKEDSSILHFLSSPEITLEEKLSSLKKACGALFDELTHLESFLAIIIKHHRAGMFHSIVECFVSLANQARGILEGYVYSAIRLSKEQLSSLEEAFSKKMKKKVELKNIVDPSLLSGVRVAINGQLYDSSAKGRLEELRTHLNQGGNS